MTFATPYSRYIIGTLPWYSCLIALGIVLALVWACREEKRVGLPKDTMIDLALWLVPAGIIGARLYYVAFAWDVFAQNPLSILYIWQGGLAIYGGLIGGALAAIVFARHKKLPLARILDCIVPGLALAQAIGRWGNYFNMEAFGQQVTDPAWQFFPFAVLIPSAEGGVWHQATFFYESAWNMAVFISLACMRKRMRRDGDALMWYMLLYGAGRMVIEGLRTDSLMAGETVRISQLVSVTMCAAAGGLFAYRIARTDGRRLLVPAAIGGVAGLAAALCAPVAPGAFAGYEIARAALWMLAGGGTALLLADGKHPAGGIVLGGMLAAALAVQLWLANAGVIPDAAAVLQSALLAVVALACGTAIYPASNMTAAAADALPN